MAFTDPAKNLNAKQNTTDDQIIRETNRKVLDGLISLVNDLRKEILDPEHPEFLKYESK